MSRLRPHTVKASLSDEEKEAVAAIAKRHEMSEAELIRFVLCNADDLDIDFGLAEIADQKFRTNDIHIRVSPEEKKKIESNAESLDMTVSSYARRVLLKGKVEKIDVDRASIDQDLPRVAEGRNEPQSADVLRECPRASRVQRESCFPNA